MFIAFGPGFCVLDAPFFAFIFALITQKRRGCEWIANKRALGRHAEVIFFIGVVAVARGRRSWRRFLCMQWNRRRHQRKGGNQVLNVGHL
jgi:hypothetical protein